MGNLSSREQSLWRLGGLSLRQLIRIVARGIDEDNLLGRAAELAFNLILAVFPLLICLLSLFGIFASHRVELLQSLFSYMSAFLPPAAFQLLETTVRETVGATGGGKLTFSLILTLWFASGGMSSMMSTLNGVYRVEESRSFAVYRAIALVLTVAISLLVLSALLLILTGSQVSNFVAQLSGMKSAVVLVWRVSRWIAVLLSLNLAFSIIYFFGPDLDDKRWYWITPGSTFGVVMWLAASEAFRVYLHFFNSYSRTYGSLGAVMILLMWLYVTGLAFLLGGEINADIEQAAALRGHPEAKAPGEKKAA
jgi:membrane protein